MSNINVNPSQSDLDNEVDWAFRCAVWEIVFTGNPECLCYDNYCDWSEAAQQYYCNFYARKLKSFQKKWELLSQEVKQAIIDKCSVICDGKDNWWKASKEQISKCSDVVFLELLSESGSRLSRDLYQHLSAE